ncbi:MAG: shikimate kinase [Candidatus Firestonebacteria bacterium]
MKTNYSDKNIVLIGFMGTGKTSTGRIIAKKTKRTFIDTDEFIEAETGISIKEMFAEKGEKYFRKLEEKLVKKISGKKKQVISTGGGIVKNSSNVKRLKKNGILFALKAGEVVILKRVSAQKDKRPLLDYGNRALNLKKLKVLLAKRLPLYTAAADYMLDTTRLTPAKTAQKILCELKRQ